MTSTPAYAVRLRDSDDFGDSPMTASSSDALNARALKTLSKRLQTLLSKDNNPLSFSQSLQITHDLMNGVDNQDCVEEEILPMVRQEIATLWPRLQSHLGRIKLGFFDYNPDMHRTLHTLKGIVGMAGAYTARALAHEIEQGFEAWEQQPLTHTQAKQLEERMAQLHRQLNLLLEVETHVVPPLVRATENHPCGDDVFRWLGTEVGSQPPVQIGWSAQAARDPMVVLGSIGAGRSAAMMDMARDWVEKGLGLAYFDAQGDTTTYMRLAVCAEKAGRSEDLRVINFMTGGRVSAGKQTHTFNPLAGMSAHEISMWCEIVSKNVAPDRPSFDAAQLVWRKDLWDVLGVVMAEGATLGLWPLNLRALMELINHAHLTTLSHDARLTQATQNRLITLLKPDELMSEDWIQFMLASQSIKLAPLRDTYGHIFMPQDDVFEVDLDEVVQGRQMLLVLNPALEKSPYEMLLLPDSVLASLVLVMQRRQHRMNPRKMRSLTLIDGFEYACGEGVADGLYSAAKKCGSACILGAKDFAGVKRAHLKLAMMVENARILVAMRQDNPEATAELCRFRIELRNPSPSAFDLSNMAVGEAFVLAQGQCIRTQLAYNLPDSSPVIRLARVQERSKTRRRPPLAMARVLQDRLTQSAQHNPKTTPTLAWCQETMARMLGFAHWHEAMQQTKNFPDKTTKRATRR